MLITRRLEFSASHHVWREGWTPERNREVFGDRASPVSHGHNYELEVAVAGEADADTGMVLDLKRLKDIMDAEVNTRFDHRDLNLDTAFFDDRPATAENLARVIFDLLEAALPPGMLARVRLRPTSRYQVEVTA